MLRLKIKIQPMMLIVFFSVLGFLAGNFLVALWEENWIVKEGILDRDFLMNITDLDTDKRAMFYLCLGRRLRDFLLLLLLSFSSVNKVVTNGFFFVNGFYTGSIIELLAVRYGMQGIVMYLAITMPHGIFYLLGYIILGVWCLRQENRVGSLLNQKIEKIRYIRNKKAIMVSIIFIIIGVFLESYLNLKIFNFFI